MATSMPFALGPMTQGTPLSGLMQPLIQAATAGGPATKALFNQQNELSGFYTWLKSQPQSAWTQGTDAAGNPTYSIAQGACAVQVASVVNPPAGGSSGSGSAPAASGQFQWNGGSYNVVGTLTTTITYNEAPVWHIEAPLGLATAYPIIQLGGVVWSSLLRPILTGFLNGVRSCFSSAASVTSEAEAAEAAETAADEAAVEGEVVADAEVSLVAGPAALVGLVLLVALPFIVGALIHPSYHNLAIYNLTPYNITWTLYLQEGAISAAPTTASGSNSYNTSIPAMSNFAPPGITPVPVAHQASFSFASTSEVKGLGYVIGFQLTDAQGAEVQTGAMAFDVPFWGDNSLMASFGPIGDPSDYYSAMEGEHTQLSLGAAAATPGGVLNLTVTYDALSGEQTMPNGQSGYLYNSVAVFSMV